MFLTLKQMKRWLHITIFEIAMLLIALLVFTILLAMKLEGDLTSSWWVVFSPLYACDMLIAYFDLIVFIHLYTAGEKTLAVKRVMINVAILLMMVIFQVLLCQQLQGTRNMRYAAIHAPVFILMFVLLVRSCVIADS